MDACIHDERRGRRDQLRDVRAAAPGQQAGMERVPAVAERLHSCRTHDRIAVGQDGSASRGGNTNAPLPVRERERADAFVSKRSLVRESTVPSWLRRQVWSPWGVMHAHDILRAIAHPALNSGPKGWWMDDPLIAATDGSRS